MSEPFFITGLPRSRTAWWSVAASTQISTCHHEPLSRTREFADLLPYWNMPGFRYAGIADSALVPQLERILVQVQPRTLIVRRDPKEVVRSFSRYMNGHTMDLVKTRDYVSGHAKIMARFFEHPLVKVVEFEALRDIAIVKSCFDWLMPGWGYIFREELMHMNVQVDPAFIVAEIQKPHNMWHEA